MSPLLDVTVDDAGVRAMLNRVDALGKAPPMALVATAMAQQGRNAFRSERDPWGVSWPSLKPATLKARRKRGNASQQKLVDSAAMYNSLRDAHTATEASVSIGQGLPDPRAEVHQFGNAKIAARPYFPMRRNQESPPQSWWVPVIQPIADAVAKAAA